MAVDYFTMASVRDSRHAWAMEVDELKQLFKASGKSQAGLAKAMNLDPSIITRMLQGRREIKAREVKLIRSYFEATPAVHEEFTSNVTDLSQKSLVKLPSSRVNDVPLIGTSAAGKDGDFSINGQVIEYVARGPGMLTKTAVYALYVQGDSMSPWRESGERVYVDPNVPVRGGDYVVVELLPAREGDPKPALLKRLIARTGRKIKLLQYNPRRELEFDLDRVVTCHHVLTESEILGG